MFGFRFLCLASLSLGGAVSAMHYLGLAAIYFFPASQPVESARVDTFDPQVFGALLASVVFVILGIALFIAIVGRRVQAANISQKMAGNLSQAIESLQDGFSLFDSDDRLTVANKRLQELTGSEKVAAGSQFEEILRQVVQRGRVKIPEDELGDWIQERLELCRYPQPGMILELEDGARIRIRANPTADGGTVVLYTDISPIEHEQLDPHKQQKLQERQSLEATLLNRANEIGAKTVDFQEALQEIVDLICQLTDWPEGHVYEVAKGELQLAPIWFDRSLVRLGQIRKLVTRKDGSVGTPLAHSILKNPKLTLVADSAKVQTLHKHFNPSIQQAAAFPVRVRGRIVVILEFLSDQRRTLSPTLPEILSHLERQLARVFERQQALLERRPPAEQSTAQQESGFGAPGMADSQEQKRILVVGENEQERIELCRILEEIGQQADPAASHEEALKLIEGKSFDLILMDLKMSGMDSQAALQAIRDQDPLRSQRVLALTATLFPDMLTRVRASGFDGFLAKPLQRSELEKAVRQLQKTSLEPSRQEGVDSEPVKTDSAEEPLSQTARAKLSVALESGDLRAVSKVAEELKRETGSRPLGQKISQLALQSWLAATLLKTASSS